MRVAVPSPEEFLRRPRPHGYDHWTEMRSLWVYLFPGLQDEPNGRPLQLQNALSPLLRGMFIRPRMRYSEEFNVAATICDWAQNRIPAGSMIIGLGIGGTLACALQDYTPNLTVFAINSPTAIQGYEVHPSGHPGRRVTLYNQENPVLMGHQDWEGRCDEHHHLPFLDHEAEDQFPLLATLIGLNLRGHNIQEALRLL